MNQRNWAKLINLVMHSVEAGAKKKERNVTFEDSMMSTFEMMIGQIRNCLKVGFFKISRK